MMVQVRKSLYETNSSSAHCVCVMKNKEFFTQKEIREDGIIRDNTYILYSYDNSFGREFNFFGTFRRKLSYAIASYCGYCYKIADYVEAQKTLDNVFTPLIKELAGVENVRYEDESRDFVVYSDSIDESDLDQDYSTYEEVPYEDQVYEKDEDGYNRLRNTSASGREVEIIYLTVPEIGGVDHQSSGLLQSFLEKNNLTLKDFLSRKDIVVIIDGDEYCIFSMMFDSGLIDKNNLAQVYPPRMIAFDSYTYQLAHPELYDSDGNYIGGSCNEESE